MSADTDRTDDERLSAVESSVDALNGRMDRLDNRMETRFDSLDGRIDDRFLSFAR